MSKQKEYGDFQTPLNLASDVVSLLDRLDGRPDRVIEPTSGLGSFLEAAHTLWGRGPRYEGFEINPDYVRESSSRLGESDFLISQQDFFTADWGSILKSQDSGRLLVVGNPPWVTNSALGSLDSGNLPPKNNFQGLRGLDAKTGKANFDIAEWILIKLIESLPPQGTIALLCKTMTARKVLRHFWKTEGGLANSSLFLVDAKAHFSVSVEACLFYCSGRRTDQRTASIFSDLTTSHKLSEFGLVDGHLVSDIETYTKHRDIDGGSAYTWRSGIKHDAAKVMEFALDEGQYRNGLGERVAIEQKFVFPLLKSSDIGNGKVTPRRFVLVTQRKTGDSTETIRESAPKTWTYLKKHAAILDSRRSSIYNNRSRFSIFGIGEYSFSLWKVAISGFYKSLRFVVVPPHDGRPVMVDDTCYLVPCDSEEEARLIETLLNSEHCQRFLSSLVFKDSKRPLTSEILRRISLAGIAKRMGRFDELAAFTESCPYPGNKNDQQLNLALERPETYRSRG